MALRFRQLQALHSIINSGTVTTAANALGISQPGISNLIAQLERQTKFPLFKRIKGRLHPTPEALVLYQEIDTVVRGLDHVSQAVSDLQNQKAGQLQLASSHAVAFGFLPKLIAQFTQDRPDMTVSLQSQYSNKIQEWVSAGLFEIGICELPLETESFSSELFKFEMKCAVPVGFDIGDKPILTPADLSDTPFIAMGADHMTHRRTREAFLKAQQSFKIRCHTHLFRNKLDFVKQGMGAALIDPFTLGHDDGQGYTIHRFAPKVTLDIAVITAKKRPLSRIGAGFLDIISNEMRALSDSETV